MPSPTGGTLGSVTPSETPDLGSEAYAPSEGTSPRPEVPWAFQLPGQGESCGRSANPPSLWHVHRVGGTFHHVPFPDVCDRRDCPTCWSKGWLHRAAGHVAGVLRSWAGERRSSGRGSAVIHLAVSPPRALWPLATEPTGRGFEKLRQRAYRAAARAKFEGGAWVFHARRRVPAPGSRAGADDCGAEGPHFHALGFGWIEQPRNRRGWVVKNLGVRRGWASVNGTARYVLDHSFRREATEPAEGILPVGKSRGLTLTVTWTGERPRAAVVDAEGRWCPVCEDLVPTGEWYRADWVGKEGPPTEPGTSALSSWRAWVPDSVGTFGRGRRVEISF